MEEETSLIFVIFFITWAFVHLYTIYEFLCPLYSKMHHFLIKRDSAVNGKGRTLRMEEAPLGLDFDSARGLGPNERPTASSGTYLGKRRERF